MPLTSKPFRINNVASFQEENIILKSGKATITTASRDLLIWSPTGGKSFTYSRRVRGINRTLYATQDADPPVTALATLTSLATCSWGFTGAHNTPCAGESIIHAYPTPDSAGAKTVAIISLLQHGTDAGEPDQLTLSQVLAAVVPDILTEHPDATDADLLAFALTCISTRFHLTAMLLDWPNTPQKYEIYRQSRAPQLATALGPYLLPVMAAVKSQLQPA